MARALIVGCGGRGRLLGAQLKAEGWQVRGTSRREEGLAEIKEVGFEAVEADPEQPGTILDLVNDVTVVVWLLGSAEGEPENLSAIHGARLERLMERLVETPVRGFLYEMGGSVDPVLLEHGREVIEAAGDTWRIPVSFFMIDPYDRPDWAEAIAEAVINLAREGDELKELNSDGN